MAATLKGPNDVAVESLLPLSTTMSSQLRSLGMRSCAAVRRIVCSARDALSRVQMIIVMSMGAAVMK
jgi:hypothetical protein